MYVLIESIKVFWYKKKMLPQKVWVETSYKRTLSFIKFEPKVFIKIF